MEGLRNSFKRFSLSFDVPSPISKLASPPRPRRVSLSIDAPRQPPQDAAHAHANGENPSALRKNSPSGKENLKSISEPLATITKPPKAALAPSKSVPNANLQRYKSQQKTETDADADAGDAIPMHKMHPLADPRDQIRHTTRSRKESIQDEQRRGMIKTNEQKRKIYAGLEPDRPRDWQQVVKEEVDRARWKRWTSPGEGEFDDEEKEDVSPQQAAKGPKGILKSPTPRFAHSNPEKPGSDVSPAPARSANLKNGALEGFENLASQIEGTEEEKRVSFNPLATTQAVNGSVGVEEVIDNEGKTKRAPKDLRKREMSRRKNEAGKLKERGVEIPKLAPQDVFR